MTWKVGLDTGYVGFDPLSPNIEPPTPQHQVLQCGILEYVRNIYYMEVGGFYASRKDELLLGYQNLVE